MCVSSLSAFLIQAERTGSEWKAAFKKWDIAANSQFERSVAFPDGLLDVRTYPARHYPNVRLRAQIDLLHLYIALSENSDILFCCFCRLIANIFFSHVIGSK